MTRIGLIGARRRRQGLGPFVARDLISAGATVDCFLGTGPETLISAQRALLEHARIEEARGYTDLEEMLERESLDALAILSPSETHEGYLKAAAEADLHVLCEKPLVWSDDALLERANARVDAFRSRGLLLVENCQWPHTLDAFRALHPDTPTGPPKSFRMRLTPDASGLQAIGDCLPHPLSVLQDLVPGGEPTVENVRYGPLGQDRSGLGVAFDYRAEGASVRVEVELRPDPERPRAASLEIDGRRAERRVGVPGYEITFAEGGRSVSVADPLTALVRAFVDGLRAVLAGAAPADPSPIVSRIAMLEALSAAYRSQMGDEEANFPR
jgi:predicted dehydrogenase